jgi:hypothetical protein
MANMSYCRFENTYRDLLDCLDNINEQLSKSEAGYRESLVNVCKEIINEYEDEFGFDIVMDEGPEYDGAGFSEEDRIVNGEYRVIDTQDKNNNDGVSWDTQTR